MKDSPPPDDDAQTRRKQRIAAFLRRTLAEVEEMRRNVPALIDNDGAAWQELRFHARSIAGEAERLELGVLAACAAELAKFADERFARESLDPDFLLGATSAIEMVAIELKELELDQLFPRRG